MGAENQRPFAGKRPLNLIDLNIDEPDLKSVWAELLHGRLWGRIMMYLILVILAYVVWCVFLYSWQDRLVWPADLAQPQSAKPKNAETISLPIRARRRGGILVLPGEARRKREAGPRGHLFPWERGTD